MRRIILLFGAIFFLYSSRAEAVVERSEIRGLFINWEAFQNEPDWDLIAQTASDFNCNMIVLEAVGHYWALYPSDYVSFDRPRDELAAAIEAAHSRGLELHAMMLVFFTYETLEPLDPEWRQVACDGSTHNWPDPCHPGFRDHLRNLAEELVTKYDIDGFMFDYIRYDREDTSVSSSCRAQFEEDTGAPVSNWPDEVCEGGSRRNEFMEWRISTITNLVRDMRQWMLAISPHLEFSAAVFPALYESGNFYPTYFRRAIAQDPADWVIKGYLDFVAPMVYTPDADDYKTSVSGSIRYFTGEPEGMMPNVIWTSDWNFEIDGPVTAEQLRDEIAGCREVGCDGWIIWRYAGPGVEWAEPDLGSYFEIMDLDETFSLQNVNITSSGDQATIRWSTSLPATSRVEYSTSQLFTSAAQTDYNYQCDCDFPYYEIAHAPGSIAEDASLVADHSLTLSGLVPGTLYYLRVQSQDQSGTATSRIYTFIAGEGPSGEDEIEMAGPEPWPDEEGYEEGRDVEAEEEGGEAAGEGCGCTIP